MSNDMQLLFIGGFPSGGTDLTKTILNAHPDIDIAGEMPLLSNLAKKGYGPSTIFNDIQSLSAFISDLHKLDVYNRLGNLNGDCIKPLEKTNQLTLNDALFHALSKNPSSIRGIKNAAIHGKDGRALTAVSKRKVSNYFS